MENRGKRTAVVICPGRGTYNKEELGYLARHHPDKSDLIDAIDRHRLERGQESVSDLDGRGRYDLKVHTRGDNASALIHACAYADFLAIDRERFEVVAVTGNSMGWYIALACAGSLASAAAIEVVNTMGTWMQESMIGGQLVYPLVDAQWQPVPGRRERLLELVRELGADPGRRLFVSIDLGGLLVFAGNEAGLAALEEWLEPEQQRYPLRLHNHAAFHTPLQNPIAERAMAHFDGSLFRRPAVALVDGRGHLWSRYAADPALIHAYTFGHQVRETYEFARAVQVAVREFAPDHVIVLGPGNTLGGAVAQSLVGIHWRGLEDRSDFTRLQTESTFLLSMGRPEQRPLVEGVPDTREF